LLVVLLVMAPPSQELEPPINPERFTNDSADSVARSQPMADCDFNQAALHPAHPIKCQTSTQRTQASHGVDTPEEPLALDALGNKIGRVAVLRLRGARSRTLKAGAMRTPTSPPKHLERPTSLTPVQTRRAPRDAAMTRGETQSQRSDIPEALTLRAYAAAT
jgi:hypothetical protein